MRYIDTIEIYKKVKNSDGVGGYLIQEIKEKEIKGLITDFSFEKVLTSDGMKLKNNAKLFTNEKLNIDDILKTNGKTFKILIAKNLKQQNVYFLELI